MIDRWHDPWVFFWIVFLYIVIHVAYGLWREDRVRKGTLSYYTAREERTQKISLIWVLIGALLFQFFTADKEWIRSRGRGAKKHNNKRKKMKFVLVILFVAWVTYIILQTPHSTLKKSV